MNPPLKKLTSISIIMFLVLMAALTYIHFFQAPTLNADSRNVRTIYREYDTDRGNIVVAGEPIVDSQPADDSYNFQRVYLHGSLYAHLTGYFSVTHNSFTGLERSQNSVLSGSDSSLLTQRIQELITGKQPQGGSVALTINPAAQAAAAEALGNRSGAVAAIEPATGRILALYSSPTFDPNQLASHDKETADSAWNTYNTSELKPLLNRAAGGDLYPPGSTFKIITASAMLEAGATPDSEIETPALYTLPGTNTQVPNAHLACSTPEEKLTLRQAIVYSCNTSFAIAGVDMGASNLMDMAKAYGFEQDLDIGIPSNASLFPQPSDDAALAMDAFGQKDIQTSPLQMAMVAAAVANHGTLMKPYLVEQTLTSDLEVVTQTQQEVFSKPISESTAEALASMMQSAAETYYEAQVPGVVTAGKTGTAENAGEPHAWYIGFDVAPEPRVAVAVFVEHAGSGTEHAGPIAAAVIKAVTQ